MRLALIGGPTDGEQWSIAAGPVPSPEFRMPVRGVPGDDYVYRYVEVEITISEGDTPIGSRLWRAYIYRGTRLHPYSEIEGGEARL